MAKLSDVLRERGYVYQFSAESLEEITDGQKRTFYLGVDPTADSMHVGQLQGILVLRRFLEDGHKLIIIVGGGTGMVGDPGGKSAERNLMDDATIDSNAEALREQFTQLFGGQSFEMVNNAEWLRALNLMEFLRDIGKHFTVNEMIKRDSVRPRLETPDQSISYTEFSYMLLQAYDFLELNKRYGCDLQVGGSDQWGNIVSGVELIRKKTGNSAYALSWPLLVNKSTGKKFGKSEEGTVWLDARKTSAYKFYQFWLNTDDESVGEFLLKMTVLPKEEIDAVMNEHDLDRSRRIAQTKLAEQVTILAHGEKSLDDVKKVTDILFGASDIQSMDGATLARLAPGANVQIGSTLVDALVATGLASSKREARQFLTDGAVTLNGAKTEDRALLDTDFKNNVALIKRGKRNAAILFLS
jgi:tyrosyl-tRNA synthetase